MNKLAKALQAAAGNAGNPNAWDINYLQFYIPKVYAFDVTKANTPPYFYGTTFTSPDTSLNGSFFTEDGLTLFLVFLGPDYVKKYTLSQPWDVTNLTEVASFSVNGETNTPCDVSFKPDGTKMYIVSDSISNEGVYEYDLSTAWDITTAVVNNFYDVSSQTGLLNAVNFKTDGTKMFVSDTVKVCEYNLSTAWDVSTATFGQSTALGPLTSPIETTIQSTIFSPDGTKLYLTGLANRRIHQLNLSTAWDVSTLTLDGNFSSEVSQGAVGALAVSSDGLRFFRQVSNIFVQYPLAPIYFVAEDVAARAIHFRPNGTKLYVVGQTNDNVYEYDLSTAWDLNTISYVQSFSIAVEEPNGRGVMLSADGTNMYVIGTTADNVTQYSLSVAWDISTSTYVQQFYVGAQEAIPSGFDFSPDGTKMFITGSASDNVHRYDLSTAWDISTASYVQSVSVAAQETAPYTVKFKTDGTKMYVAGITGDDINQYALSTPWDVTTASFEYSKYPYSGNSTQVSNPYGLYFRQDGELLFVSDSRTILSYSFSPT